MKIKEIELQKQIVQWLNYNHYFVWRNNSGLILLKNKRGKVRAFKAGIKGCADIIGTKPGGQFLAIEVKVGNSKPTDCQIDFLEKIKELGGDAFVVWSLEDVMARLEN